MPGPAETLRLLVVDDDLTSRVLCERLLRGLYASDVEVDLAASGEEAVALLRERSYGAILADYKMEWMSGVDLLELASREHPDAARLLLTGHASIDLAREALQRARIHAFILKPLRVEALREAMRHVVGARPRASA